MSEFGGWLIFSLSFTPASSLLHPLSQNLLKSLYLSWQKDINIKIFYRYD